MSSMAFSSQSSKSSKNFFLTQLLAILLGGLGAHRFYVGKIGTGFLMLFTVGGGGAWWLYDIVIVTIGKFTDAQGKAIRAR